MLTWKVWADQHDPVFEGTEQQARSYIVRHLPDCLDAVLGPPDGRSYGYHHGIWVSLDPACLRPGQDPRDIRASYPDLS